MPDWWFRIPQRFGRLLAALAVACLLLPFSAQPCAAELGREQASVVTAFADRATDACGDCATACAHGCCHAPHLAVATAELVVAEPVAHAIVLTPAPQRSKPLGSLAGPDRPPRSRS